MQTYYLHVLIKISLRCAAATQSTIPLYLHRPQRRKKFSYPFLMLASTLLPYVNKLEQVFSAAFSLCPFD
jgi:hypothetical protein